MKRMMMKMIEFYPEIFALLMDKLLENVVMIKKHVI